MADRWYDEVKQYNFNRPGFSSGTGEIYRRESLIVTEKIPLAESMKTANRVKLLLVYSVSG